MKTVRHTRNLVRLTRLGAVNAFLVVEDDGLTLVDTMLPKSQDAILAAARELGAPIARIALTHAHGDHVGSLDALAAAGPTAEVSISAPDARPRPRPRGSGSGPAPPGGSPAKSPPPPASRSPSCAAATPRPRRSRTASCSP